MAGLSEAELARRSGTTTGTVRRLTRLGILTERDGEHPYEPGDVQRIRLAEAVERSGLSLDAIGSAIAKGELSFAFVDVLFPQPAMSSDLTFRELASEMGTKIETLQRLYGGLGLPRPLPDTPVREDDAAMLPDLLRSLEPFLDEEGMARVARFFGENLRRVAESEVRFFHAIIEEPILHSGMPQRQMLEMGAELGSGLRPLVDRLLNWLHDRHLEHYIIEDILEHVESAVEEAGVVRERSVERPAIAFLDLTGYTRLTEERGDQAAAELAARLAELVQASSEHRGGRPVKWLGDGVMFHFREPSQAVLSALEMVEQTPRAGLPSAHVGIHAGPVIFRDGDYYGRTVNIAARISGAAGPSQILVSDDVVSACGSGDVRFDEIGMVPLKGIAAPVRLHIATRTT